MQLGALLLIRRGSAAGPAYCDAVRPCIQRTTCSTPRTALQHIKHAACRDPVCLPIHSAHCITRHATRNVRTPTALRSGARLTRCSDEPARQCPSRTVPPPHPTTPSRALRLAGGSIRRRSKATRTRSSTSPLACCGSTRRRRAKRCSLSVSQRPTGLHPCCSVLCHVPSGARARHRCSRKQSTGCTKR